MRRNFLSSLLQWKSHPLRTPLIVRGARQVGKTYSVELFGREQFESVITINFESSPEYQSCFEKMEPLSIVSQIELISRKKITPGKTLLFLDEIQQCPKALQALRYFKEQLPELHLIAAGSLLEFSMRDENFSFPVGRVQFATLYPLSFEEYLEARGDVLLKEALSTFDCTTPPPLAIHNHLLTRVHEYFIIGGMPASILAFIKTESLLEVKRLQEALLNSFEADFGKYAKQTQHRHMRKIFSEVPRLIGEHIKYSRIDPELPNPAREMKQAIELLRLAGLLFPIAATTAGVMPLLAGVKETIFKLLFLDIGLVHQFMNIDQQNAGIMAGPLAEQFVGQELLAAADPFQEMKLFFWTRPQGDAEVDYLFQHNHVVYPLEVKAGKSGKLKSLQVFLEQTKVPFGIRVSKEALGWNRGVLTVPFYLVSQLPRLLDSATVKQSNHDRPQKNNL